MAAAGVAVAAARRELVRRPRRRAGRGARRLSRARARARRRGRGLARRAAGAGRRGAPRRGAGREPRRRMPRPAAPRSGPHRSDSWCTTAPRGRAGRALLDRPAEGLLISIVLAEARLRCAGTATLPILLLDEVTAHLDPRRRRELFEQLWSTLGAQAWLTGTDAARCSRRSARAPSSSTSSNASAARPMTRCNRLPDPTPERRLRRRLDPGAGGPGGRAHAARHVHRRHRRRLRPAPHGVRGRRQRDRRGAGRLLPTGST